MRASGILMHISSLPGEYGCGTLGKEAYSFVDFLDAAKQKYWQVLPVCPTGYGHSPYQSYSSYAGNPSFIDPELLYEEGLLTKDELSSSVCKSDPSKTDFEFSQSRIPLLRKAFGKFKEKADYEGFHNFENENEIWISNYALYMTAKSIYNDLPWYKWDDNIKKRDPHTLWTFKNEHGDEVFFWMFVQYEFYKQWSALKKYANGKNIKIIGDIPIYVAADSVDVWVSPELFELDEDLNMINTAGCPPDAFSPSGQVWGNPLYRWENHKKDNYSWWTSRISTSLKIYDIVRIDHFRGFESYFSIPADDKTAENGHWKKGPGEYLFNALREKLGYLPLIAEDLGALTPEVFALLEKTGLPGMKILEFAFDTDFESIYLPHNHIKNCVVYTGTHDNDTLKGWYENTDKNTRDFCNKYTGIEKDDCAVKKLIAECFKSVADTVIIPMQDHLMLTSEARMNTPSTVSNDNWAWRAVSSQINDKLASQIAELVKTYYR